MKTLYYLFLVLVLISPLKASLTPYTEAVKKAKEENKFMVVYWNGSDWSPEAGETGKKFEEFAAKQNLPVIWCEWDERNKMTKEEEESEFFKKMAPPVRIWNIPAVVVLSPDNKPAFKWEGVKAKQFTMLTRNLPHIMEKQIKAEKLWKEAEEKEKEKNQTEAISLYGQGFELIDSNLFYDYRDLVNKVKKLDPEDKEGIILRNNFRHGDVYSHVTKMIKENKDYEGAEKYVDEKIAVKGLSIDQKQKLLAAKFFISKEKKDEKQMLARLQDIIKLDASSEMGRGARYYYDFLTKPVIMKGNKFGYEEHRPGFSSMLMDASPYVKSPGKYKVECVFFTRDKCDFRNARFISGKREIAKLPDNLKDKTSAEFVLEVPSVPSKLQLEIEIKGRGWYKARGEIRITKM